MLISTIWNFQNVAKKYNWYFHDIMINMQHLSLYKSYAFVIITKSYNILIKLHQRYIKIRNFHIRVNYEKNIWKSCCVLKRNNSNFIQLPSCQAINTLKAVSLKNTGIENKLKIFCLLTAEYKIHVKTWLSILYKDKIITNLNC